MRKLIITLLISSTSLASNLNKCTPLPESKRYIDYDFTSSFPKTATFSCDYLCTSLSGTEKIKAIRQVQLVDQDSEGTQLVCQGVVAKRSRWGYELDRIDSFFAHNTSMVEIKNWAYESGISLDDTGSEELMKKLIETSASVAQSYLIAGNSGSSYAGEFKKAALILLDISNELPSNTTTLDKYMAFINDGGDSNRLSYGEGLVLSLLRTYAAWRIEI
jgi:hypothetical protein